MIKCTNCGEGNREGILFCDVCGYGLTSVATGQATIATKRINDTDANIAKATWGAARFKQGSEIIIHVRDAEAPVTVEPAQRLIFGRSDVNSTVKPDIDFASYGAIEKGVSRQHAALEVNEDTLMILDVGSSNGTYLNGQRLLPNQPRVLRDGDEVRLGKLVAHIYFK
ncbi:MAG: FHA domain-containing protein [Phototrophicaceae bacterium]